MIKTSYQTPELRDANDNVVQEGAFGKNTALSNSTNDGWIDYVMNDLEALHDTIGDSAPTLDGNGHVVEPANLAIGDEDGVRLKTGYLKTSGGTVSGTLNIAQNLKMQDNQENVFGGFYVPASSATSQFLQVYGGETPSSNGGNLQLPSDGSWTLQAKNGTTAYDFVGGTDGTLKWRGNNVAVTASPAFTGSPTAPTQATNNNSTRLATTAYVVNDLKANVPLLADAFAEAIPSGADLNDYNTQGTYRSTSGSITDSLSNCPVTGIAFKLIVFQCGYNSILYGIQILMTSLERIYVRSSSSTVGSWRQWKRVAFTDSDITGNAATATKAMQDGDGNVITDSYTKKLTLSVPANKNGKIRVGCNTATSMFFSAIVSINCAEGRTWNRMYAISGYGSGTSSRTKSYMFPTDDNNGVYTVSVNGGFIEFAFSSSTRRQIVYANVSVLAENPSYPMSISFIEEST